MNLVTSQANPIWNFRRANGGPRRIVHVPPRLSSQHRTGAEADVLELAKHQLDSGMEPIIITTLAMSDIRHEVVSGIRVHRHTHSYFLFGSGEISRPAQPEKEEGLLSIPIFQSLMQEPEVRLYHSHTLGRLGSEVLQAARMRYRPYVVTVHDNAGPGSLTSSLEDLQDADMVIFPTEYEAEQASARLGHKRVAHLPHGVDCAHFASGNGASVRETFGIPAGALVIGNVIRPDARKMSLVLESFAQAAADHPAAHLLLDTAQLTSEDSDQLATRIQGAGLETRVHRITRESSFDRVDLMHACDVLIILPHDKPSSMDVLEAWSAQRPLITDRFGGVGTLIRDGDTGLLFDPESSTAAARLAEHIEQLAANPDLRRQMAEKGSADAAERDWSRIVARLEQIYQLAEKYNREARRYGKQAA